jgi:hypothetical protein
MPPVGKGEGCVAWSCDQFKGMYVYRTFWKLPKGFTCDHCKMQFYYLTGSRCWPPCDKANKGDCQKPVAFGYCGQPGQSCECMLALLYMRAPLPAERSGSRAPLFARAPGLDRGRTGGARLLAAAEAG